MAAKTGYSCTLSVGGVSVANLTEVSIEATRDTHDSGDLGDEWQTREPGLKAWSVTGRANYNGTNAVMVSQIAGVDASVVVEIKRPDGTTTATIFKGNGLLNRGTLALPMGVGTQEVAVQGTGAPSTIL